MNKILTLYDIEFKRIYKLYFSMLFAFIAFNVGITAIELSNVVAKVSRKLETNKSIKLLQKLSATRIIRDESINRIFALMNIALIVAIAICLLYAFIIWYRDFIGKSKTAYTLFMLPNNKFDMYIAKLLTIVFLIYGVIIAQILSWVISISIVTSLTPATLSQIKSILGNTALFELVGFIQLDFISFIMINIIGVIISVMIIFTGIIIQKSFKKVGILLGIGYIFIFGIMNLFVIAYKSYSGQLIIYQTICYLITALVSVGISYRLLNKDISLGGK